MAPSFEFIVLDPAFNPKPGKSLQIRRHCMQGRNRNENSRRSRRARRKQSDEARNEVMRRTQHAAPSQPTLLRPHLSDIRTIHLADPDIELGAKCRILKTLKNDITNQTLSPLDCCVNFESIELTAFEWLCSDTAFLHSTLMFSCAVQDFKSPRWDGSPSSKTTLQLQKTLSLLQNKICSEYACQDESALYVVLNLAMLAAGFGDWKASIEHLNGLQKIVQIRGDQAYLKTRPKLHFRLDRIDLIRSLSTGKQPLFQRSTVSWDPIQPIPRPFLAYGMYSPPMGWDVRVANVFRDLQYLSLQINRSVRTHAFHDGAWFQEVLTSLQARLMHMAGLLEDPVEELVRLAMLAFLTAVFHAPGGKMPYRWITKRFRAVRRQAGDCVFEQERRLVLWILTVTASVTGARETWVEDVWREVAFGLTWRAVKELLMQVMWIEVVHDGIGETVFVQLNE